MSEFLLRVDTGFSTDIDASQKVLNERLVAVGGQISDWTPLGGQWQGQAKILVSSPGALKLVTDQLEAEGAALDLVSVRPREHTLFAGDQDPSYEELIGEIQPGNSEWDKEAAWWEDWSVKTGTPGDLERRFVYGLDELGVDDTKLSADAPLGWKWVETWVWDSDAQAVAEDGPSAPPPEGWNIEGKGKWISGVARLGFKLSPVGRAVEIASAVITMGGLAHKVYKDHVRHERVKPPAPECHRRQSIRTTTVRERIVHERTPRGAYFRHYYSRADRFDRY